MCGSLNMHMPVCTYIGMNRPAGLPLQFLLGAQALHPDFLTSMLSRKSETLMPVYYLGMALEYSAVYTRWATQRGFGGDQSLRVLGGLCSKCPHPISQKESGNVEEGLGEWRHPFIFKLRPRQMA